MLKFYARFEISDETGDPMSDRDMTLAHYSRITSLQKAAFAKFPDLRLFALANVASVDTRETLQKHFGNLSDTALRAIATYLNLVPPEGKEEEAPWHRLDKEFLKELLISRHERRISQLEELNSMPLYPTEEVIWDENVVPTEIYSGDNCLALPKLNLQFLTLHDYLLRNFNLFRLESTYEIRQDIEDAVYRLAPWRSEDGSVYFGGWARMAHPIKSFAVVEVAKPNIGEKAPSRVRADVTVTLSVRNEIKHEWENLRKHDVCFLVTVRPTQGIVVEVAKPNIGEKAPSRVRADVTVTLSVRNEIKHEWENLRKHDVCFLVTVRPTQGIVVEVTKPNIGEKAPSRVRADVTVTLSVRNEIKHEWENLRKHDVCFLVTVRPTQGIVVEVAKPNIGEKAPSRVRADVTVTLSVRNEIKHEWENLRKHDVCFLVTVRPTQGIGTKYDYRKSMVDQAGIVYVRGCEVEGMLDASGRVIEEGPEPRPQLDGDSRTFRLLLDPNQYRVDLDRASKGGEDVYETFNIVMRRKPKENNFKAVLETIRELMNTECVVPEWLHDIVLGYGDPGQAHYTRMPNEIPTLDFNDTFLDMEHLRSSFPGYEIKMKVDDPRKLVRPFNFPGYEIKMKVDDPRKLVRPFK
ncbi:intron-binding protein aquarius [Phthorimaea operculella]|nr:intron-binding protein aquarius [Phthorimaea operculella]